MLNFCDFIQVYVFTTNHHLKVFFLYANGNLCLFIDYNKISQQSGISLTSCITIDQP